MSHDFFVAIHGERGKEWERITGTNRFPVRSPSPVLANLPGFSTPQRVFLLALDQLSDEDRSKISRHLAAKFGLSEAEAADEVQRVGIPILESECTVIVHRPQRWF